MALPFNANTPQPNDVISQTQNPIQQNFASIGTAFNNGSNTFSQYAIQNVSAPNATTDPLAILHSVLGVNALVNQGLPYWRTSSGDYPLLPDLKTVGSNFGFKFGNIIINYGIFTLNSSNVPVTFAIPYTTTNISIAVTPSTNSPLGNSGPISYNISTTTVTFHKPTGMSNAACSYFAIGT